MRLLGEALLVIAIALALAGSWGTAEVFRQLEGSTEPFELTPTLQALYWRHRRGEHLRWYVLLPLGLATAGTVLIVAGTLRRPGARGQGQSGGGPAEQADAPGPPAPR